MARMIKVLKMTCKDVYPLISESQDHPLTLLSRIRLKMHLARCELCKIYQKQLEIICSITLSMGKEESKVFENTNMSPAAKEKIKELIAEKKLTSTF